MPGISKYTSFPKSAYILHVGTWQNGPSYLMEKTAAFPWTTDSMDLFVWKYLTFSFSYIFIHLRYWRTINEIKKVRMCIFMLTAQVVRVFQNIVWNSSCFVDNTWCITQQTYTWARPFLWVASGITVVSPDINVYRNLPTIRCYCSILNSLHCTYEQSYTSQVFSCTDDYWAHFIDWRACLTL